jgi:DNA polymerase elongation subunit (family B)
MSRKVTIKGKSFKLIDFHFCDQKPFEESDSEKSESESESDFELELKKKQQKKLNGDDSKFIIQMFGIDEKGMTCSIIIQDYQPFFYVECGNNWLKLHADILLTELKNKVGGMYKKSILKAEIMECHKLYGFTGGTKSKFIKLTFSSTSAMNKVKYLWYQEIDGERKMVPYKSQNFNLKLYESNLPPLLRYFHIYNISPSGWILIRTDSIKVPMESKTTTCNYEYLCNVNQILSQSQKETIVPYKICSFDIEASSSHGDFPLPIKTYKRLAANIIDIYYNNKKNTVLSEKVSKLLIEKIIYTAFGYNNFENVDKVFPKTKISDKKTITNLLTGLFTYNISNQKDKSIELLMTIESAFNKYEETSHYCEDGGDEDENENEDVKIVYKKKEKILKNFTIIDLLNSYDGKERDDNVLKINEVLCIIFPPLEGDKVTFIGSTFTNYGESEPYLNHCLVLNTCDDVPGIVIKTVKTEAELLIEWALLIQNENPDIMIGYNIFGFDYDFMFRRSQETNCMNQFLSLSRKKGEICLRRDKVTDICDIENTKIVLATGEYDLKFPKMTGRIQIDMYTYLRRDFNLSSYKLDDVAGQYISDDIKYVNLTTTTTDITELYTNNITGLHINDFIHIEIISFTSDYYKDGKKFRVIDIIKDKIYNGKSYNVICIDGHENIGDTVKIKWCMAKDDVTPQDIFRLSDGSSTDRAKVAKYCIQDCNLVHQLLNKIDVITGYIEMARICSVPISFLVFRGQGIKLTSYVAKKCREKNTLMPDLQKSYNQDGYEGAIVLPPKCAMYMDNPVACVDYASLYPSAMISQNYSHDSKVWTKEYDNNGNLIKETGEKDIKKEKFIYDNLDNYKYINIEFDTYKYIVNKIGTKAQKTKTGTKTCRWVQLPNQEKSIMPSILEELLKARADTRKMIKTTKDPFMQNILDKRQLGYKVTANSLYGQCGAKTSTFYEQDVAASTTATGRMMITYAQNIIENVYGNLTYETKNHGSVKCLAEYIYGDTDSVFFTFNLKDSLTGQDIRGKNALEITIEIAQDAAKLCTQFLTPPMELTYEKTLMQFILLSKKRYVGMLYENEPINGKMKFMGLSLKRRDSCDYLKDTYGGILRILMKDNPSINDAILFLEKSLNNLIEGIVPMDKLSITKALRGYYKNPKQIAHSVLSERIGQRDPGNKPKSGERIKFVHIVNHNKKALQGDKIETPEFIIQNNLVIDYSFYITNQLMKPLQQLFGLALEQIWNNRGKLSILNNHLRELSLLEKNTSTLEEYMKKKEKICSSKIKVLLFDKFLENIYNKENNIQQITQFFHCR